MKIASVSVTQWYWKILCSLRATHTNPSVSHCCHPRNHLQNTSSFLCFKFKHSVIWWFTADGHEVNTCTSSKASITKKKYEILNENIQIKLTAPLNNSHQITFNEKSEKNDVVEWYVLGDIRCVVLPPCEFPPLSLSSDATESHINMKCETN